MKVRKMQPGEEEKILKMKTKLAEYHRDIDPEFYAEDQKVNSLGNVLVAECDGKIVGFLEYSVKKKKIFPRFKMDRWLRIDKIWVEPEYRGKGIGRALVKQAEKIARESGLDMVEVFYHLNNPSVTFWKELGYEERLVVGYKLLKS